MRKILLVSGCSWTDPEWQSDHHPNLDTKWPKWPELLAKKLDMDIINLGRSGAGNEYISSTILEKIMSMSEKERNNIGLVIPAWSKIFRRDYQVTTTTSPMKPDMWWSLRWDTHGDIFYLARRFLRHVFFLQTFLENYKIPYKSVQTLGIYKINNWEMQHLPMKPDDKLVLEMLYKHPLFHAIKDENFLGWPVYDELGGYCLEDLLKQPDHFVSMEDWHPNASGQELLAEKIYEDLQYSS